MSRSVGYALEFQKVKRGADESSDADVAQYLPCRTFADYSDSSQLCGLEPVDPGAGGRGILSPIAVGRCRSLAGNGHLGHAFRWDARAQIAFQH